MELVSGLCKKELIAGWLHYRSRTKRNDEGLCCNAVAQERLAPEQHHGRRAVEGVALHLMADPEQVH